MDYCPLGSSVHEIPQEQHALWMLSWQCCLSWKRALVCSMMKKWKYIHRKNVKEKKNSHSLCKALTLYFGFHHIQVTIDYQDVL